MEQNPATFDHKGLIIISMFHLLVAAMDMAQVEIAMRVCLTGVSIVWITYQVYAKWAERNRKK